MACAFVHGRVGVPEIEGDGLNDEAVLALSDRIEMSVDPAIEARFPDDALARVTVTTTGGRAHGTGPLPARGIRTAASPLTTSFPKRIVSSMVLRADPTHGVWSRPYWNVQN